MYKLAIDKLTFVNNLLEWYNKSLSNPNSKVLPHPEYGRWKKWSDDRIWCSVFFSIGVKGGSRAARDYLESIEKGLEEFELPIASLTPLEFGDRMRKIWRFGRGYNRSGKALGRFFSKDENFGRKNSFEKSIAESFGVLEKHGFAKWFREISEYNDDRKKAHFMEELPGVGLKVSRDFLNDIGMTNSLIALDIHVLAEMRDTWKWAVPPTTPNDRTIYEAIEDGVRAVAESIGVTVLEIDKAIYFSRMTAEFRLNRND